MMKAEALHLAPDVARRIQKLFPDTGYEDDPYFVILRFNDDVARDVSDIRAVMATHS
jgi:hypothetical protein